MSLKYEVTPGNGLVARHAESLIWVGETTTPEAWESIGSVLDLSPGSDPSGADTAARLDELDRVLREFPGTVFAALIIKDGQAQGILRGPVTVCNREEVAPATGYEQYGITVPFAMSESVYVGYMHANSNPPALAALLDLDAGVVPGGGAWAHPVSSGRRHSGNTGSHTTRSEESAVVRSESAEVGPGSVIAPAPDLLGPVAGGLAASAAAASAAGGAVPASGASADFTAPAPEPQPDRPAADVDNPSPSGSFHEPREAVEVASSADSTPSDAIDSSDQTDFDALPSSPGASDTDLAGLDSPADVPEQSPADLPADAPTDFRPDASTATDQPGAQSGYPSPDPTSGGYPEADGLGFGPSAPAPQAPDSFGLPPVSGTGTGWASPEMNSGANSAPTSGFVPAPDHQRVDLQEGNPGSPGSPLPVPTVSSPSPPAPDGGAVLVFDDGSTFTLDRDYVVGRRPEKDARVQNGQAQALTVVDPDTVLSSAHALISRRQDQVVLQDLGSLNGTHVAAPGEEDWTRLPPHQEVPLTPGTRLLFGWTVATYSNGE